MKNYLELIPIFSKIHQKQTMLTRMCIVLAVVCNLEIGCFEYPIFYIIGNSDILFIINNKIVFE